MNPLCLVVGATGMLGQAVVQRLIAAGYRPRALVRSSSEPSTVERLRQAGADVVVGDVRDPASLRSACNGVKMVVSTATAMMAPDGDEVLRQVDDVGQVELVRAARAAGVDQFVYVSLFDLPKLAEEPIQLDAALLESKRRVEGELRDAGIAYTIVRPAFFREIWLSPFLGFDPAHGSVMLYGTGEQPVSFIALDDVASFCVGALSSTKARNQVFELGGPEAISLLEAAKLACPASRQPEFGRMSIAAIRAQIEQLVLGPDGRLADGQPVATSRLALLQRFAQGLVTDNGPALAAVPLNLQPVSPFLRAMAAEA